MNSFQYYWQTWHRRAQLQGIWTTLHIDIYLLLGIVLIILFDLLIIYSASGGDITVVAKQGIRFLIALSVMVIFAQIHPNKYHASAIWLFLVGVILLLIVFVIGHVGKGAQRWLNLGLFRFQPSEFMKIATPMVVAWYLSTKPLPPSGKTLLISGMLIIFPVLIIAEQPDLGTAIMVGIAGFSIIFLAGIHWRWLVSLAILIAGCVPLIWHFMHDYQRNRVLTFLNPENDPLGSGYHIIQSKIAIGSGGLLGKGWLAGTQTHLKFLPESSTDFIFSVVAEEFGFLGALTLIGVYLFTTLRCLTIARQASDSFTRLLAGGIGLMFFCSVFINIGMVCGLLPVVGLPLPLLSYGGTSILTLLAAFGILMSIQTHRKLIISH